MKKLIMVAVCAVAIPLMADTEIVDGYTWTYRINDNTAEINNITSAAITPLPIGSITIPSKLGGKPVTSIGGWAFYDCSGLTSVEIPSCVTSIGAYAFHGCSGLTSVVLPDSVIRIGGGVFDGCSGLTSVIIGNHVDSIEDWAFYGCSRLKNVTIPNSVTNIGNYAFCSCNRLEGIVIGNKVERIGDCAFSFCSGLTSIRIPDSVTSIGKETFEYCSGLTDVRIGNGVTSVGHSAFNGCNDSLFDTTSILGVKLVDGWAVEHIYSLSGDLDLAGARGIGEKAFQNCDGLTSVAIPNSVISIGNYAFQNCINLTSVSIGNGAIDIGEGSFEGCTRLASAIIGNSVTMIGKYAFYNCSELTSVTIPDGVTSIGVDAFYGCRSLMSVTLPKRFKNSLLDYGIHDGCAVAYTDTSSGDESTSEGNMSAFAAWQKARILKGIVMNTVMAQLQGIFILKCGKANRKGSAKVSATLIGLDGKKKSYRTQSVNVKGETVTVNFDGFSIMIDGDKFTGSVGMSGGMSATSAEIGGNLSTGMKNFNLAIDQIPDLGNGKSLVEKALPLKMTAKVSGGKKLDFGKAASPKYAKDRNTGTYVLKGLDDPSKPNLSGLKLSYTPNQGVFKGVFKIYTTNEGRISKEKKPILTKNTVNVIGFMINGRGIGEATLKKSANKWVVTLE